MKKFATLVFLNKIVNCYIDKLPNNYFILYLRDENNILIRQHLDQVRSLNIKNEDPLLELVYKEIRKQIKAKSKKQ